MPRITEEPLQAVPVTQPNQQSDTDDVTSAMRQAMSYNARYDQALRIPSSGVTANPTWTSWNSQTASSYSITNEGTVLVTWEAWNTINTLTTGTPSTLEIGYSNANIWVRWAGQVGQVTPQVAAAAVASREQYRQELIEAEAERAAAQERAQRLLRESLSPKQLEEYSMHGHFFIDVLSKSGQRRRYKINKGRARNVQEVDQSGRVIKHFCAHPSMMCPDEDTMLAQKLMLEAEEEAFLRIANVS